MKFFSILAASLMVVFSAPAQASRDLDRDTNDAYTKTSLYTPTQTGKKSDRVCNLVAKKVGKQVGVFVSKCCFKSNGHCYLQVMVIVRRPRTKKKAITAVRYIQAIFGGPVRIKLLGQTTRFKRGAPYDIFLYKYMGRR